MCGMFYERLRSYESPRVYAALCFVPLALPAIYIEIGLGRKEAWHPVFNTLMSLDSHCYDYVSESTFF